MRYLVILIYLFIPLILEAQLSAPGSNDIRYTNYPSSPSVKDPVFIFCNSSGSQKGTLTAESPGGTGPYNFSWYKWNDLTDSFSDFLLTESGVTTSTLGNLGEGGYKVNITGGYTGSLTGWIHIDRPYSSAALQNRTCDYVALRGRAVADTFYYKDPTTSVDVKLQNRVKFMWSSDPQSVIPYPDILLEPQTFTPPLVDVVYKLHVSDSFGCVSESSFPYESIHVKAEFTAEPVKGDAPLEVVITDKSIRGNLRYKWDFGETTPDGRKAPEWIVNQDSLSIFSAPFTHTYYRPGEYSIKLTIESNLHCIDSFRFEPDITVDPSKLEIPNVFTPNGDNYNDYFMVEAQSLRWISVEVFSRSGLKVYSFFGEGESLRQWQGWDGNVNSSSIKASPGVYFYIIKALGWDDIEYDSKEVRGFVYLYR